MNNTGNFRTLRGMGKSGNPKEFPMTKNFLQEVGSKKIVAALMAVSFFVMGATGLLEFFFPENNNNGRSLRGDRRK